DAAWLRADSVTMFTQTEPREGSAGSAATTLRVLAAPDALYIGIRAASAPGVPIVAFARDRDASLNSEDHVKIVIDSYLDGRSGYVFAVNPNGARYDALVANQGESENAEWDGVWEAATTQSDSSWSVEIRIPVKSILFRTGLTEWGFNVQRRIQALQETDRWATPRRQFQLTHVSQSGLLTDLPAFDLGAGLSIRPALVAGSERSSPTARADGELQASLDATQRIGANTLASLTVNTDFAETEVDTRRTNLTRFPLLFPEKRVFFLEGADQFDFGLGTGNDVRAFFTRRIGLLNSREVPLNAGLKINGRERGANFGALVVRTGLSDAPGIDTLPTANTLGVVRLRRNILSESSIGAIATAGDPLGRGDSWLAGPDVTYQTSRFRGDKNFLVGAWGLAMQRGDLPGTPVSFGGKIDYPNDLWDLALTYKWIDSTFQPSLGFVPRPGVQIVNFNVTHQPRPRGRVLGLPVRQMNNEFLNTLVLDTRGEWESYRVFVAPVNWRLVSGDRIELNVVPTGERLTAPFAIAEGVVIPAGSYHWNRYRAEAAFAAKRKVSGQLTWWFGDFYTGSLHEVIATAAFKPSALFIVETNFTRNVGDLAEGRFTQQVVGTRLRFNVSADLQFNTYLQYDNQSDLFGSNARMRWAYAPTGDLFVVYNHNMVETLDEAIARRRWGFASSQLLVKLQHAFRY
ncbi:MAG TPA: DUF5916 domain-containing protein, partial [Gemmatimonadaceae bacterium]|nr:DUF5916 domain-containing protein [Gemmatimonadaceae bacterium]